MVQKNSFNILRVNFRDYIKGIHLSQTASLRKKNPKQNLFQENNLTKIPHPRNAPYHPSPVRTAIGFTLPPDPLPAGEVVVETVFHPFPDSLIKPLHFGPLSRIDKKVFPGIVAEEGTGIFSLFLCIRPRIDGISLDKSRQGPVGHMVDVDDLFVLKIASIEEKTIC